MLRGYGRIIEFLAGGLAGLIALAPFIPATQVIAPKNPVGWATTIALFLIEGWIAVLFHELGHAIAAYAVRWRIHIIVVWPLAFVPKTRKFISCLFTDIGAAGVVLATPAPQNDRNNGEAIFVFGGVAANLLTSAVAFIVVSYGRFEDVIEAIVGPFAVLSLILGIFNLIPIWKRDGGRSDGARLLDIARGHRDPALYRLARLSALRVEAVPASEWDSSLVEQVEADAAGGSAPDATYRLLYTRYLETTDLVRARATLEHLASRFISAPDWIRIEQAFFFAYLDKDGIQAKEVLSSTRRAAKKNYAYWRALAIACDVVNDGQAAIDAVRNARAIANKAGWSLHADDLALLNAIQEKAKTSDQPIGQPG